MTEPEPRRFTPREEQPWWMNALHWVIARKTLRKTILLVLGSSAFGGVAIWALMFLTGASKMSAIDTDHRGRMAAIEARAAITAARVDTNTRRLMRLDGAAATILNAVCADFTRAQQRSRQMECDPEIYRGAPGLDQ